MAGWARVEAIGYWQAAGCDGRIGSSVTRDMCDVCGGANNTCQRMAAVAFPTQVLLKTRNNQPCKSPLVFF